MGNPSAHPGLQRVAGLQVGGAHPVALLQLRDAVPVIQLLWLILARAHVEAVPAWGGQGDGSHWGWKARRGRWRQPPAGLFRHRFFPHPWTSSQAPQGPAPLSATEPAEGLTDTAMDTASLLPPWGYRQRLCHPEKRNGRPRTDDARGLQEGKCLHEASEEEPGGLLTAAGHPRPLVSASLASSLTSA